MMKRLAAVVAAAATLAVVTGALGAQLAMASTCTGKVATNLTWTRVVGHQSGTLRWTAPAQHPTTFSYRVLRNGTVIGQTTNRALAIRVTPGRKYVFGVRLVSSTGVVSTCHNSIERTIIYHKPAAPKSLKLTGRTSDTIKITWPAGAGGDARMVGYRILRNGTVVGQTASRSYALKNLFSSTTYTLTVRTVDTAGITSANSPPVTTTTLAPTPSTGTAHAFVLASTDRSFEDFRSHYKRFGVVYPTYYDCKGDGSITGSNDKLITSWSQARKVKVLPRINCQSQTVLHEILTDSTARAAILNQLIGLVDANDYDGLNIDFESGAATDRAALTSFIQDLASAMHSRGKTLSVCVAAAYYNQLVGRQGFYDYKALGAAADHVFVMGWGLHWATSGPGSIDDINWEKRVVAYVATMPSKSKYVLGLGMYGMDWANGGGAANPAVAMEYSTIRALMAQENVKPAMDPVTMSPHFSYTKGGVPHEVWYQNTTSLGSRIELARANGLSVGFWHLGEEDPNLWDRTDIG